MYGNVHGKQKSRLIIRVVSALHLGRERDPMWQDVVDAMNQAISRRPIYPNWSLPPAPTAEQGPVKAWHAPVSMLTYMPADPDPNPLFLEKRVYQGSSGRVYPLAGY
jgi:hypothetical protein